ncbi:MAG: hypothetical protein KAJ19_18920, partial [Gammaproteobacteria bacterium]|nr:hypothetical protein [Gammaproteobacteria bacterium]
DKGVSAIVGERNTDELVFPLKSGINMFVDALMDRISNIELPSFGTPDLALAGAPAGNTTLVIGTFIGDKRGLKELYRRLDTIGISENQRKGL